VSLPGQSLQVLAVLLERRGELVSRETLRESLWPAGTYVDFEHGLNAIVKRLRDALGDSARTPLYIETLPRRGYRFIGAVERPRHPRAGRSLALRVAAALLLLAACASRISHDEPPAAAGPGYVR
jgi:DNA-binding winged helix-turn-helix (wHTH) protein